MSRGSDVVIAWLSMLARPCTCARSLLIRVAITRAELRSLAFRAYAAGAFDDDEVDLDIPLTKVVDGWKGDDDVRHTAAMSWRPGMAHVSDVSVP